MELRTKIGVCLFEQLNKELQQHLYIWAPSNGYDYNPVLWSTNMIVAWILDFSFRLYISDDMFNADDLVYFKQTGTILTLTPLYTNINTLILIHILINSIASLLQFRLKFISHCKYHLSFIPCCYQQRY